MVGLFILYSASGRDFDLLLKQTINLSVAFLAMLLIAQFKLKTLKILTPIGYVFGLLLLIAVVFFGTGAKGAQRWLDVFGIFSFQPSELMKIVVPLTVAAYLSEELLPPHIKIILISFLITLIPCFLIFMQPDLGTSILIASSGFFVIWLAELAGIF